MDHNNKNLLLKIIVSFSFLFLIFCFFSSKPLYAKCETWCNFASPCSDQNCNTCPRCPQASPTTSPKLPQKISGEIPLGNFEGLGPLGENFKNLIGTNIALPLDLLNRVISIGIGLITLFAFLYFILQFFTAALKWITAGGDQKSVEAAGKQITNALIGLVIVVSATFIIELVGMVLGIELLNPFDFLKNIWKP